MALLDAAARGVLSLGRRAPGAVGSLLCCCAVGLTETSPLHRHQWVLLCRAAARAACLLPPGALGCGDAAPPGPAPCLEPAMAPSLALFAAGRCLGLGEAMHLRIPTSAQQPPLPSPLLPPRPADAKRAALSAFVAFCALAEGLGGGLPPAKAPRLLRAVHAELSATGGARHGCRAGGAEALDAALRWAGAAARRPEGSDPRTQEGLLEAALHGAHCLYGASTAIGAAQRCRCAPLGPQRLPLFALADLFRTLRPLLQRPSRRAAPLLRFLRAQPALEALPPSPAGRARAAALCRPAGAPPPPPPGAEPPPAGGGGGGGGGWAAGEAAREALGLHALQGELYHLVDLCSPLPRPRASAGRGRSQAAQRGLDLSYEEENMAFLRNCLRDLERNPSRPRSWFNGALAARQLLFLYVDTQERHAAPAAHAPLLAAGPDPLNAPLFDPPRCLATARGLAAAAAAAGVDWRGVGGTSGAARRRRSWR